MTLRDADVAADFSVRARFDELCRRLQERQIDHLLDRPLGHWALVGDRRLPYALLDLPLRKIIHTPFAELSRTRGVGTKKLRSLLVLLQRAVTDDSKAVPLSVDCQLPLPTDKFHFESVCESHWELWRQSVRTHHLAQVPLGRFAPTLAAIPSVIWTVPLGVYLNSNLAEMREMKSHGDKRLRAVVEVFFHIHRALGESQPARHLSAVLRPAFAWGIEQWLGEVMPCAGLPSAQELRNNLLLPALNQIELDAGPVVGQLAAGRMGIESAPESVVDQAERLRVTRARVYQLLDVCGQVLAVRWPEGRWQLAALGLRFQSLGPNDQRVAWMSTLQALLYPDRPQAEVHEEPELVTAGSPPPLS